MEQVNLLIERHRPNQRVGARVGVRLRRAGSLAVHGDHDCGEYGEPACDAQKGGSRAGAALRRLAGGLHDSAAGLHFGVAPRYQLKFRLSLNVRGTPEMSPCLKYGRRPRERIGELVEVLVIRDVERVEADLDS